MAKNIGYPVVTEFGNRGDHMIPTVVSNAEPPAKQVASQSRAEGRKLLDKWMSGSTKKKPAPTKASQHKHYVPPALRQSANP